MSRQSARTLAIVLVVVGVGSRMLERREGTTRARDGSWIQTTSAFRRVVPRE